MITRVARQVLPITKEEFSNSLSLCLPPNGIQSIGVANSGGPDSTCLLHLMKAHFDGNKRPSSPQVISFYIDHDLQAGSSDMASIAASTALRLSAPHMALKIPWGSTDSYGTHFPPKPPSNKLEELARDARYRLLFIGMTHSGVNTIAFGHHADDQVETALLRLAKGSTLYGAAGMRPLRRWGMGSGPVGGLQHFGYAGMEPNGLEYYVDQTNFQPDITLRNAIRATLKCPEDAKTQTIINEALCKLPGSPKLGSDSEQLRHIVGELQKNVERTDSQVDILLKHCMLPSPPGTLLLDLSTQEPPSGDIKRAFILRVLRYISNQPWGSLHSTAHQRTSSILRIAKTLWDEPLNEETRAFSAGANVLWRPAIHDTKKQKISVPDVLRTSGTHQKLMWLVGRPPVTEWRAWDGAHVDVTDEIRTKMSSHPHVDFLYDHRYVVRFNTATMPDMLKGDIQSGLIRVRVEPCKSPAELRRAVSPCVELTEKSTVERKVVHNYVEMWPHFQTFADPDDFTPEAQRWKSKEEDLKTVPYIRILPARTLTAI